MSEQPYTKLTGKRRKLLGFSQVWLGGDHLLLVKSSNYVERYRRFALEDIQAIVITESRNPRILQIVAMLASLASVGGALNASSTFSRTIYAVVALMMFVVALLDMLRGQRCRCIVQTAVSQEALLSVDRFPKAKQFLDKIVPAIIAAQSGLAEQVPPPPLPSPVVELDTPTPAPSLFNLTATTASPPELPRKKNYLFESVFGLFLLTAVLVWMAMHLSVGDSIGILMLVFAGELTLCVVGLLQVRSRFRSPAIIVLLALFCLILDVLTLTGPTVLEAFAGIVRSASDEPPNVAVMLQPDQRTTILAVAWRATAGLLGLGTCYFERRGHN